MAGRDDDMLRLVTVIDRQRRAIPLGDAVCLDHCVLSLNRRERPRTPLLR